MAKVVNPRLQITVFGESTFTVTTTNVDYDISKDLDEEPNAADLSLYNLKDGTRKALKEAANADAPIEIALTPSGVDELTQCFRGEVESCRSRKTHPGHETILHCVSQQINHRAKYVEREFKEGTSIREIVNYLLDGDGEYTGIGLPHGTIETIPDTGILLSQSICGAAFPLLKRVCFDLGFHCYILDGTINITSVYTPTSPTVTEIPTKVLLETPEDSSRSDALAVEQRTVVQTIGGDPFDKVRKKPKKKKRVKLPLNKGESVYVTLPEPEPYSDDYTEYETVDTQVEGMIFECLLQPGINPDDIVSTPTIPNRLFRVITANHHGNNDSFDEWTTSLECDEYEDQTGELVAGIS